MPLCHATKRTALDPRTRQPLIGGCRVRERCWRIRGLPLVDCKRVVSFLSVYESRHEHAHSPSPQNVESLHAHAQLTPREGMVATSSGRFCDRRNSRFPAVAYKCDNFACGARIRGVQKLLTFAFSMREYNHSLSLVPSSRVYSDPVTESITAPL